MKSEIKNLVEEIKQIREQYEAEVGVRRRRAWPRAIKERVVRLCELTGSIKDAAELADISKDSVYAWRSKSKVRAFNQLDVVEKRPVTVTDTSRQFLDQLPSVTVTVTTPRGFLIEGLPPAMAVEFLIKIGVK